MPVRAVLHVALQVVSALGAATFQLVMHRAIHPGNLLIVSGQTTEGDAPLIKVLHFGRADPKFFISGKRSKSINKAAPFASPEQLETGTVDFRSEIYSLGCTLWSLLTGVPPFNAPGKPLAGAQMAAAMKRFRGVPRKMRRLITQMAATNPDDRPLDPVVMTQQLQDCLASVERREAIARRLGIPATWQRRRVAKPVGPLALRPFAMAVVLLAAALTAFGITNGSNVNSFWKRFSDRGPIGTPVGVSETLPASSKSKTATPATNGDTGVAAREAALLQNLNAARSSASNAVSTPPAATSPVTTLPPPIAASANQNTPAPSPNEQNSKTVDSPIAGTASSPAPEVADTPQTAATEPATVADSATFSAKKIPRAELIEGPPSKTFSSPKHLADSSSQSAVPRAELVAPPPPTEGPDDAQGNKSASKKDIPSSTAKMENVPRAELIEPPPGQTIPQKRAQSLYAPTKSELAAIRTASRRANRARIWADGDGAMVQTPDGMVHARLVGTTPDGQWMLALPSRKIIIVPPPPDFISR